MILFVARKSRDYRRTLRARATTPPKSRPQPASRREQSGSKILHNAPRTGLFASTAYHQSAMLLSASLLPVALNEM
jgi:hypothetical protein